MKKYQAIFNLKMISRIVQTPIVIGFFMIAMGFGLFFMMRAGLRNKFVELTSDHELKIMGLVEKLGGEVIDAKLADLKRYCIDMLLPVEWGLYPGDIASWTQSGLQSIALPQDGLNLAYWFDGELVCRDDAFRAGLETLDIASVKNTGEGVIFNPYFDDAGNFVLTVAAAAERFPGVLIVQYDGFCISRWLSPIVSLLDFGTAYIIDSEGYNIAAAREEEREWITTRYNARQLAKENPTTENVSIANLEGLALAGEQGLGTYEWAGSTSYVAYGPLEEVPWGYCVGFYESEFTAYTENIVSVSGQTGITFLLLFGSLAGGILALIFFRLVKARSLNREVQIQKIKLEKQVMQDSLTGVKNKRAWQEDCEQLDREIETGAAEFAIAVCDVNGLKRINDTVGHEAGDNLIVRASNYICKIFSHSPVYRIGGDEFTVVLQGEDLVNHEELIAAFDSGLEEQAGSNPAPLSIAIGVSHYELEDLKTIDIFHRADKMMYRKKGEMKAKGR